MEILRYCCEDMKADINLKDNDGYTSFDHLCELKNNHNILKYLGKNNLLTDESIKNSKLSRQKKLRYFTQSTSINLNDSNYVLY